MKKHEASRVLQHTVFAEYYSNIASVSPKIRLSDRVAMGREKDGLGRAGWLEGDLDE
jgi:hypothetical protein